MPLARPLGTPRAQLLGMSRTASLVCLAFALALAGCQTTTCEELSTAPTGDLAVDLIGTWDGFGTDSRLVYVFEEGGAFRWVEPPNMYAPDGLQNGWPYSVDGDIVTFEYPDSDPALMQATVTADTLTLTSDWEGENPRETSWARSTCSGYGF
jgi:hypothetical protein